MNVGKFFKNIFLSLGPGDKLRFLTQYHGDAFEIYDKVTRTRMKKNFLTWVQSNFSSKVVPQ